jgi:methylated-DNA-protein-cysteine methyltransferase related protein
VPAADPQPQLTPFEAAVDAVLARLDAGDVVTYGEVAAEAGYPGAARAVGAHLARNGTGRPWWRVVSASGRLVPGHEVEHARRLRAEGVAVDGDRRRVARFRPERPTPGSRSAPRSR